MHAAMEQTIKQTRATLTQARTGLLPTMELSLRAERRAPSVSEAVSRSTSLDDSSVAGVMVQ
jgi:hypothetical protein